MSESYRIYGEKVGFRTFNGEPMKCFDELPENIQNAWIAVDLHHENKMKDFHRQIMSVCINYFRENRGRVSD